ncbi:MAG: SMC-Scp complex subunit ScpB [Kofleriaceae bacterium]|nr:SMC-Scp complex subunit ScpB [Kofleriaceae bacterium]MBP9170305.1 SMC-Scp complex subunit ScpB [Kofleriaceae bacterium]MBP9860040.1 SMC-Scp complex subunit ScpB [Kofleriaceae bacterium]
MSRSKKKKTRGAAERDALAAVAAGAGVEITDGEAAPAGPATTDDRAAAGADVGGAVGAGDGEARAADGAADGAAVDEVSAGEERAGQEPAGEELAGEELAGEELAGEVPGDEVPAGEEPAGEVPGDEVPGDEVPGDGPADAPVGDDDLDGEPGDDELDPEDAVSPMAAQAAQLDDQRFGALIEALLFAADRPLTIARLRQLTRVSDTARIAAALERLAAARADSGIVVSSVSGGYSLRTHSGYSPWVQQLIAGRPVRLSRAQLETLAIVAYRQPITRPEIDQIRGVDSGATLKLLLDRSLIRILGKREEVGRPLLYGTTKEFLDFFSLNDLRELPTLREYSELSEESRGVVARMGLEVPPARSTSGASDAELIAAMTDGATVDGAAVDGAAVEEAAVEGAAVAEAPVEDEPVEDAPIEDAPVEDAPVEDAPAEDAPVEDAPIEDAPVEDAPVEDAPIEDAPIEDAPVDDAPVEDAPVEDAPIDDAPIEDAPIDDAPIDDAPVEDAPVEDAPVEDASIDDAPIDDAPIDDALAEDPAVSDEPVVHLVPDPPAEEPDELDPLPAAPESGVDLDASLEGVLGSPDPDDALIANPDDENY